MLIIDENLKSPNSTIFTIAYILASVGLSPLLFATLSFLRIVSVIRNLYLNIHHG